MRNSKNFLWKKLLITLKANQNNFRSLKNSKILITGGTGFVGSWIVHSLAVINKHYNLKPILIVL